MAPREPPLLARRLGVFSATTIIVGSMIGSGIFIAPSIMAGYIASPGLWLGLWLVGRRSDAARGALVRRARAMMPHAGGQYVFLREAFGPRVAFLYGWTLFLVIQTGFNAAVAIAFAKFLGGVGLRAGETDLVFAIGGFTLSRAQIVAVGRHRAAHVGQRARACARGRCVQNVFTVLKVGAIALLALVGVRERQGSLSHFALAPGGTALGPKGLALGLFGAMGVAMSKALFAYDAWNTVTFTAGEVREPQRNLPRALVAGTVVTTLAYTAACAAYLYVLPIDRMAGVAENRVAVRRGRGAPRTGGGHARLARDPRVDVRLRQWPHPRAARASSSRWRATACSSARAGRVDPRRQTPRGALVLQGVWSVVLALSGTLRPPAHVRDLRVARFQRAHRRRRCRLAPHARRRAAALSHVGLSGDAGALPRRRTLLSRLHLRGRPARRLRRSRARRARVARVRPLHAAGAQPGDEPRLRRRPATRKNRAK